MGDFCIKCSSVLLQVQELETIKKDLSSAADELSRVKQTLRFKVQARNQIDQKLNNLLEESREHLNSVIAMKSGLEKAVTFYKIAEKSILDHANGKSASPGIKPGISLGFTPGGDSGGGSNSGGGWDNSYAGWISSLTGSHVASASGGFTASVLNGSGTLGGDFPGKDYSVTGNGSVLGAEGKAGYKMNWDIPKKGEKAGDIGVTANAGLDLYAAKGEVEAKYGSFSAKAEASLLNAGVAISGGLMVSQNGKFDPCLELKAKASASVAKGSVSTQQGNDVFNTHQSAEGTLLGAEASAGVQAGRIANEDGSSVYGVKAEAGAEAYLARGEVKSGFTMFGIKVDAAVGGKAGAVGAKASAAATTDGVQVKAGLSVLLGIDADVKIDWSGAKLPTWSDLKFW
ncbi:hypothetical protein ABFV83_11390 [Lacrimispora sp. BS-2]|uniref:Uncharacterized protein n=1 Tax=Lacrimispora sp. BS-2 TaxID=3151850 RepID=A0AAU7PJC5_9FIRM